MKYIDYVQLSPIQKFTNGLAGFFVNLPKNFVNGIKFIISKIIAFFIAIGLGFKNFGERFVQGGWSTKLSYFIMGTGCMAKGQIVKGILFLAIQVGYIMYMTTFAWQYICKVGTLGTVSSSRVLNNDGIYVNVYGDNSMLILLYSVLTLMVTALVIGLYVANTKSAKKCEDLVSLGKKPMKITDEIKDLLDQRYHITLLSLPVILVGIFTIIPLIFMILIAFTNYDSVHQPPDKMFTWIGFGNFTDVFFDNPKKAYTFQNIAIWTMIWAVVATFSNYFLGIIFSLMINKKSIKCKSLFRTLFVIAIAVPQFVTLLLMAQMLNEHGVVNVFLRDIGVVDLLHNWGWVQETRNFVPFLVEEVWAKFTVIFVNMWIGIPFTILITSGILMNIPEELYESARIDGASPVVAFFKITMPYMLFVTTPYLIQQFIGNINNFNLIFFLTNGGPAADPPYYNAGSTDLLVTWLYKLTMEKQDYALAATIGILVFLLSATISLVTFNLTKSAKNEEEFS